MKTRTKVLGLMMAAVLLVSATIFGTMAYLTDNDTVTNAFTVGKVAITLDEARVNVMGKPVDKNNVEVVLKAAPRVSENTYKLMPGHTYTKDPTVHVEADSEDSYIFVKVENGLDGIEESGKDIATQITNEYVWAKLNGIDNVYYKLWTKKEKTDLQVFGNFALIGDGLVNGTKPDGYTGTDKYIGDYQRKEIVVTAYAVQADGFANDINKDGTLSPDEIASGADAAWEATFGK